MDAQIINDYPVLTWETLDRLERKAYFKKITAADCTLLDHYLTSIGCEGWLMSLLEVDGIFSFDDIAEAQTKRHRFDMRPYAVSGFLLGFIHTLMDRLRAGEKIY